MRVWVSGARGFVGSHLVARLAREGHEVIGVDREVDVRDAAAVERSLSAARADAVVHLAARASVARSLAEPVETARVNFLGAHHVLRVAARRAPGARVLLVTSSEIYGEALSPSDQPFDEGAPLRPASPYARAKAAADLLGARWAARGLDVVRVRPFPHLGPGQSDDFAASSFARQIAEIEAGCRPAEIRVGNLDAVRDFLDVEDVVDAYLRLLGRATPPGAWNVASGIGVPVRRLLDGLLALSTAAPAVRVDPARVRSAGRAVGDATRLRRATGWQPRIPLAETLARLLGAWRAQVSASR